MFCIKCGEVIPDGSQVCPKCGANLKEDSQEKAVVYASPSNQQDSSEVQAHKTPSKNKKIMAVILICVIALAAIVVAMLESEKSTLKKSIVNDWYDTDGTIIKVLDVKDESIEYRLETGYSWMDTTLGKYNWKVASGNTIKVDLAGTGYRTYTIQFNDDKNVMKISPALTSTASSETWYHVER